MFFYYAGFVIGWTHCWIRSTFKAQSMEPVERKKGKQSHSLQYPVHGWGWYPGWWFLFFFPLSLEAIRNMCRICINTSDIPALHPSWVMLGKLLSSIKVSASGCSLFQRMFCSYYRAIHQLWSQSNILFWFIAESFIGYDTYWMHSRIH